MIDPRLIVVKPTFEAINDMLMRVKREFDEADRSGEDLPGLVRMIEDPDFLAEDSAEFCLQMMREHGRFRPWIMLMTRRRMTCIGLAGAIPNDRLQQIMIATSLRVLVAATSMAAYWIGGEIWFAFSSKDPGVGRLRAGQREDKREGLLVVSATAASYRASVFETVRADGGEVTDVREVDLPPGALRLDNPMLANFFEEREKFAGAIQRFGDLS